MLVGTSMAAFENAFLAQSVTAEVESKLKALLESIADGELFKTNEEAFLVSIYNAFRREIDYLKTAYVANTIPPKALASLAPSEILFNERYPEVDRTLTGVLILRWIYHNDYDGFTRNQPSRMRLTQESFRKLRNFFQAELDDFRDSSKILTLITLQVTNDLGKSEELKDMFVMGGFGDGDVNHDMLLHRVLTTCPALVPSIQALDTNGTMRGLIALSSEYNPGQLTQGESMPALLEALPKSGLTVEGFRLKFMESFLDISGALGHIDHDGSFIMTDPVFIAYDHARRASERVLRGDDAVEAWKDVLGMRLGILQQRLWHGAENWDVNSNEQHLAKARLLCMARAVKEDVANKVNQAFDHYLTDSDQDLLTKGLNVIGDSRTPAVLPTYIPEMFSLVFRELGDRDLEIQLQGLSAVMSYLGRVLHLSGSDLTCIRPGVLVVERDMKEILKPIIESTEFHEDPWSVLNDQVELPRMQIAREVVL